MSATMDQFRLRNNSPKNIRVKQTIVLNFAVTAAKNNSGVLISRPKAQTRASAREFLSRSLWAIIEPNGTPNSPDIIVITPNLNATLESQD